MWKAKGLYSHRPCCNLCMVLGCTTANPGAFFLLYAACDCESAHTGGACVMSHMTLRARVVRSCVSRVCARALGHATRTPRPTDEVPTVRGLARGTLGDFAENVVHVLF